MQTSNAESNGTDFWGKLQPARKQFCFCGPPECNGGPAGLTSRRKIVQILLQNSAHCTCGCMSSLEPGPSRARYFSREMLLLTTTARERAWRLLKITSPLIGWFDGDSPIPGISPWLAPLSRCTQYIVEVQRTLCRCLFVFEIRTAAVGWHQPCILP